MKQLLILFFWTLLFLPGNSKAQKSNTNLALHLDGNDNNVCIGMGIIESPWTWEAWIKGDDNNWKESEVIIGGGEYSNLSYVDDSPLQIRDGKLHSPEANLWSKIILDSQWHHVALTCDGKMTTLFLDGEIADKRDTVITILPGSIGTNNNSKNTFGGLINEVRIWKDALSGKTIKQWMSCPVLPSHPSFKSLIGYYPFDSGLDDSSVNWVGKGYTAYHIRNSRIDYKKNLPMAYTVENDNPRFIQQADKQEVFNVVAISSEWDVEQGEQNDQLLKIRIAVRGTKKPLQLEELTLDLSETSSLTDIANMQIYYTGNKAKSDIKIKLFETGRFLKQKLVLKNPKSTLELKPGINYILITGDISKNAVIGNTIKVKASSIKFNKKQYSPEHCTEMLDKKIIANSKTHPNLLRILQWNIWHGGVHLGNGGVNDVINVIKSSKPDIITMQEGYGSQERIASALGFYLQTPSPRDNLALFSRYPIEKLPSSKTFQSNPGKIKLPNGRTILVNASWLRYAYRPDYTGNFPERNQDTDIWIKEDSILALADISAILENDINPVKDNNNMPVIIGGDFNSCSHLDWTEAAAPFHYGYGPVNFPVSRFMYSQGYKDSFREINPDEAERPEGTYSNIFGHLQNSRIDFLYYKGAGIKALRSKIIRTSPEIDYVWPSDHEAVITDFEIIPANE